MTQNAKENSEVFIRSIISEHRKFPQGKRPPHGSKRVMAIVSRSPKSRHTVTRHVDTKDGQTGTLGDHSFI